MASFFTASRLSFRRRRRRGSLAFGVFLALLVVAASGTAALALIHEGII